MIRKLNIFILLLLIAAPSSSEAAEFTVFTNTMPPIKEMKGGIISGVAGDVLKILMRRVGHPLAPKDMHMVSWKEALDRTAETPNSICLAISQSHKLADSFKWVGPVYTTKLGIIAKSEKGIRVKDFEDIQRYTIGTFAQSAMDNIMIANGVPADCILRYQTIGEALDMLVEDQIDLLAFTKSPTYYLLQQRGINPASYEMVLDVRSTDLYIAFNPSVDDTLIERLQAELDAMKEPGSDGFSEYDRIVFTYFQPIR